LLVEVVAEVETQVAVVVELTEVVAAVQVVC
jgi:hypothetical protein